MRRTVRGREATRDPQLTPASYRDGTISPPSKAANTTRLPKSEKRILNMASFIKPIQINTNTLIVNRESEYRQILVRNARFDRWQIPYYCTK